MHSATGPEPHPGGLAGEAARGAKEKQKSPSKNGDFILIESSVGGG